MITIVKRVGQAAGGKCLYELRGLSTDTKPTGEYPAGSGYYVGNGSEFIEIDTQLVCLFDEENSQWDGGE